MYDKCKRTKLVEIKRNAIKHIGTLGVARRIRFDEADSPKGECEDEGASGQDEAPCQSHQGGPFAAAYLRRLLVLRLVYRHDLNFSDKCFWAKIVHLIGCVKNNFQEGYRHSEEHPDANHLDVRSDRQALGKSQKSEE